MGSQRCKIFLSYNTKDRPFVSRIAHLLTNRGFDSSIEFFFDIDNLAPGDIWLGRIEEALTRSGACLIFIGEQGIGPWQNKEALKAVDQCVTSNGAYKIIPVILPYESPNIRKNLPWFLADYQWVEFTKIDDSFAFEQLLKSISKDEHKSEKVSNKNPYKGLDFFTIDDEPYFFGRAFDLNWIFYKKLRLSAGDYSDRFLAIVGDSGSGKSSFVRAGILAALKGGRYKDSATWKQVVIKPGDRPLLNLSAGLEKEDIIANALAFKESAVKDRDCLRLAVEVYGDKVVLCIDQFEEVLTQCGDEAERAAYLANLIEAVQSDKLLLLVTLRSDFYASFSRYKEFAEILESSNYTLSGFDFSENNDEWAKYIQDIIEIPARLSGVKTEREFTKSILEDIKSVQGALPVLQMALAAVWKGRQQDSTLTSNDYERLTEGKGIGGIIEKHAEEVYKRYTGNEQNSERLNLIQRIFLRLVEITEVKEDVRKTVKKEDLLTEVDSGYEVDKINYALNFLSGAENRLLRIRKNEQNQILVEVIHEVLIRKWVRLRSWINERREALRFKQVILKDIEEWKNNDEDPEFLYNKRKLAAAKKWMEDHPDLKNAEIERFIRLIDKKDALLYRQRLQRDVSKWGKNKNKVRYLYSGDQLKTAQKWLSENSDLCNSEMQNFLQKCKANEVRKNIRIGIFSVIVIIILAFTPLIENYFQVDIIKKSDKYFDYLKNLVFYIILVVIGLFALLILSASIIGFIRKRIKLP